MLTGTLQGYQPRPCQPKRFSRQAAGSTAVGVPAAGPAATGPNARAFPTSAPAPTITSAISATLHVRMSPSRSRSQRAVPSVAVRRSKPRPSGLNHSAGGEQPPTPNRCLSSSAPEPAVALHGPTPFPDRAPDFPRGRSRPCRLRDRWGASDAGLRAGRHDKAQGADCHGREHAFPHQALPGAAVSRPLFAPHPSITHRSWAND